VNTKKTKKFHVIDWDECPECGDELVVESMDDPNNPLPQNYVYDGDPVRCASCGCCGFVSADEDGVSLIWNDDRRSCGEGGGA
jgi:uncharacterized protein with PIN domain